MRALMNPRRSILSIVFLFSGLVLLVLLYTSCPALAANSILKSHIIAYNLRALEKSLVNGTYRGEEGILRIRPEIAESMGMKVIIDQDYLDSMRLFKEAKNALREAKTAMASREKERFSGYYDQRIADHFLLFRRSTEEAKSKLIQYRSRIDPDIDERLNKNVCASLIDRILDKSFKENNNRLRDGLAYFYNMCQGVNEKDFPLTPENVSFVNHVFNKFLEQAPEKEIEMFDLDRDSGYKKEQLSYNWKDLAGIEMSRFSALLEAALHRFDDKIYQVDPLLFISLMKKESAFDHLAISSVGAAGLTQIMPRTAKDMGMNDILLPGYFIEAESLIKSERENRRQAMTALFQIREENGLKYAKKARKLMQTSLGLGQKRERLFARYRKELLEKGVDERLQPAKAIEYGLKYFAKLLKDQNGDISLALASYNAGPHRVREYKGIPPYAETVDFRNRVLQYYWDYLSRAKVD